MNITDLSTTTALHLDHAKRLLLRSPAHKFIRHNGYFYCDFAGHLLAYVAVYLTPNGEYPCKLRIVDADDWEREKDFKSVEAAIREMNRMFGDDDVVSLKDLEHYGF